MFGLVPAPLLAIYTARRALQAALQIAALLRTTKLRYLVLFFRRRFVDINLHLWLIGISQYSFHHQSNAFASRCPISNAMLTICSRILDVD
jgi:hypothetical protein